MSRSRPGVCTTSAADTPTHLAGSDVPPSFVHRITKYDPADRDEHGHYTGAEEAVSDHGPVEAAYLAAIAAFAEASDIDRLEIRDPGVAGFVHFGVEPSAAGHGLDGLFPPDLSGYHDGAEVSLPVALELVRVMLRGQGAWCRLEAGDRLTVDVGWDQYVYVGSDRPCTDAVARTRELGLFPEPMTISPSAAELDEPEVTVAADRGSGRACAPSWLHARRCSWRRAISATRRASTVSRRRTSMRCVPASARALS